MSQQSKCHHIDKDMVKVANMQTLTLPGRGYRFRGLEGGGAKSAPLLEINEGVVSDPRLLYRSLT